MSGPRPAPAPVRAPRRTAVLESELAGGLHALAVRRPHVPLVELRLVFPLTGRQISEPADPLVFSESLMSGTAGHDRSSLAEAVGLLGGTLGGSVAGDYFVVHASAFSSRLGALFDLLAEVLSSAAYPPAEVEGDKKRRADEVTIALSHPETVAAEALARRLYGAHPYGAALPRPDAVLAVTPPKLRRLHDAVLRPAAGHLVVVGAVSPSRALALAGEHLASWLDRPGKKAGGLPVLPPLERGPLELVDRPGSVQSNIRIGGRMPGRSDPSWPAAALANAVLGGMFTSRITENLRERNGYSYSPYSVIRHMRAGSSGTIAADVSTDVTAAALVEARYEIARLASGGVSEEELDAARRYLVGSFLFQTASQAGLASTLASLAVSGIGPGYLSSHPARLAAASKAEVDEAARRFYAPRGLAGVVVGDAARIAEPLASMEEVVLSPARP